MKGLHFILIPLLCIQLIDSAIGNKNNTDLRIVGGIPASSSTPEFPWIVLIRSQYNSTIGGGKICGGSILNSGWIVTSAHCAMHHISSYEVIAGVYNRNYATSNNPKVQIRKLRQIVVYPAYNHKTYQHDIALLQVKPKFKFTNSIKSIPMLSIGNSVVPAGTLTITAGWGTQVFETQPNASPTSDVLRKVLTPVIDNKSCQQLYHGIYNIGNHHICTGENGKSSCAGDSGGPVMCRSKKSRKTLILCGVVSGAKGCGDEKFPQVNANIPYYKDWIKSVVN